MLHFPNLGAVHKGRPHSEGREFDQCGYFANKGGSSDVTTALFGVKNSVFSKFMVCPHGQEGSSRCGQERRGQFFAILCGSPLLFIP